MAEVENWTNTKLLEMLRSDGRADVEGGAVMLDGADIWLTNPYGLDCAFYAASGEGCESILHRIKSDTHEREWGTL